MEYRQLPRGTARERFSVLGLGMGGIQESSDAEITATIRQAIANGINYFDLCASSARVFAPFGQAIRGHRDEVFLQLHLGAVYNGDGDYAWSRDPDQIRRTFRWELEQLGTDHTDMGFLHCVDEDEDLDELCRNGVVDYLKELRQKGAVRHMAVNDPDMPILPGQTLAQ